MGGPDYLGGQSREGLLVTLQGADFQTEHLNLHFLKGGEEHPGLGNHLSKLLATGGPKAG